MRECDVDLAECVDVGKAIELSHAGYIAGVTVIRGICAGAGVGVDRDEPVDVWVRFDGAEDRFPGGSG